MAARIASCNVDNPPNFAGGTSSTRAASCQSQAGRWLRSSPCAASATHEAAARRCGQPKAWKCASATRSRSIRSAKATAAPCSRSPARPLATAGASGRSPQPGKACRRRRTSGLYLGSSGASGQGTGPRLTRPEPDDLGPDPRGGPLDLVRSREAPQAQPQRALRQPIAATERTQHIGRLGVQARAGRAGGHGEVRAAPAARPRPPRRRS